MRPHQRGKGAQREHPYLYGSLHEQRDYEDERAAKRPPEVEGAHVPNSLGTDRVDDPGQDVDPPRDRSNLDSREGATLTDLCQRSQV